MVALKNIPLKSPAWNFIIVNRLFKEPLAICHWLFRDVQTWAQRLAHRLQWTNYRIWCIRRAGGGVMGCVQLVLKSPERQHPVSGLTRICLLLLQETLLYHISGSESRSPLSSVTTSTSAVNVLGGHQIWKWMTCTCKAGCTRKRAGMSPGQFL